jgi:uncharacterized protein (TIGR02265 family)
MIQIKGGVLKSRLGLVEQLAPEDGLKRVLAEMSPPDQAALRSLLDSSWYPFELGQRLDDAVVKVIGGGRTEFFEKIGEASAERNLGGVHKKFLVEGNPQAFLAKASLIYSFYYDQGRREYQAVGPKEAVLTTYDAETYSTADCLTVVGWYRKALEMCGAAAPKVEEEECRARGGKVCRYRITWS